MIGPPYVLLDYYKLAIDDNLLRLWEIYSHYFIEVEWLKELRKICGVDGKEFMKSILSDPDFNSRYNSGRSKKFEELLTQYI